MTAKEAFREAKNHADHAKDTAMSALLIGLIELANQIDNMHHHIRQIQNDVDLLKKR